MGLSLPPLYITLTCKTMKLS